MPTCPIDLTEQFYFCSMPLRLDTYLGCGFNCTYCFAKAHEYIGHLGKVGRGIEPADPHQVFEHLRYCEGRKGTRDIQRECLAHGIPLHWGGMSEPFQPAEKKYQISRQVMERLNWYAYPTVISTKSPMIATEPYLSLLKGGRYIVQMSIITQDREFARRVDYQAPNPDVRLRAVAALGEAGIPVVGRIQPVIPGTVVEYGLPEFIYALGRLGMYHVSVEGLKLNVKSPVIREIPGLGGHFRRRQGFELFMTPARKWRYIKPALQAARQAGISCGVADNELRDLGTDNCCIGDSPGWPRWTAQTGTAYKLAKELGRVTLEETLRAAWLPRSLYHLQDYAWTADAEGTCHSQKISRCLKQAWRSQDPAKGPGHLVCLEALPAGDYRYRDPVPLLEQGEHEQLPLIAGG
jgi:DNA repair photolyase